MNRHPFVKLTILPYILITLCACGDTSDKPKDGECFYNPNSTSSIISFWEGCSFIHGKDICQFYSTSPYENNSRGFVCSYNLKNDNTLDLNTGVCSQFRYLGYMEIMGMEPFQLSVYNDKLHAFISKNNALHTITLKARSCWINGSIQDFPAI